jgi:predicted Zn-dependent protease
MLEAALGRHQTPGDYGILYVEPIREVEDFIPDPNIYLKSTVVHELGHGMGLDHDNSSELNIMNAESSLNVGRTFNATQIRHMRSHAEQTAQ